MASGGVLRELLAVFGFDVDTKGLEKGENKLQELVEAAKKAGEALLAALAVEKIQEFAEGMAKAMHGVEHYAAALGISTEKVEELKFAAESMGEESDALLGMMGRLQVSQEAAARGAGQQAQAFARLGVHVRDAGGQLKSADELLMDVADGLARTEDPAKRAALATELFGRQGRALLPMLVRGREGFEEFASKFRELGGGFDEKTLERSKDYHKTLAEVRKAWEALKAKVFAALEPILKKVVGWVTALVSGFRKLVEGTHVLQVALVALGAGLVALAMPALVALAPFLALAAAIGAVILLVDDLIGLFTGKDSLIGREIDKWFGKGASTKMVEKVKELWHSIAEYIHKAVQWIRDMLELLNLNNPKEVDRRAGKKKEEIQREADVQTIKVAKQRAQAGLELTPAERAALGRMGVSEEAFRARYAPALPRPALAAAGAHHTTVAPTVNVHVQAPPGTDPKRWGQVAGAAGAAELHRQTRAAAATLQRGRS